MQVTRNTEGRSTLPCPVNYSSSDLYIQMGQRKKKTQNFSKTCRNSAQEERVNSMWKLPAIVDLPIYTGINWSVMCYLICILCVMLWYHSKFFDFHSGEIWLKFLLVRNAIFIHCYKNQTMFGKHTLLFFNFVCKKIEIWNKNQHMDE